MQEHPNRAAEKMCPNCKGGNAPAALVCQWCGTRLDSPYTPLPPGYTAPQPVAERRPRRSFLPIVLVLVVACVALAVIGSLVRSPGGGSGAATTSGQTGQTAQQGNPAASGDQPAPEQATNRVAGVGDTLETSGLRITLNSVRRNAGGDFFKPKVGHEYLVLDLTYENTTAKEAAVSSLISASVKDSTGQKYTFALGGTDKSSPDGSIAPGDLLRGEIPFEVPTDATGLVFTFDPILGGDPVRFSVDG